MTSSNLPPDSLHGHMVAMDDTDRMIVDALRADGRMSMRALADLIHISRASAYARVARLEREGGLRAVRLRLPQDRAAVVEVGPRPAPDHARGRSRRVRLRRARHPTARPG